MKSQPEYLREIAEDGVKIRDGVTFTGGTPVATGAGTTTAGTQRVVLPTDQAAIPVNFASATRTIVIDTVSASGTVAAGKKYISFILSSDFAGTIDGETFAGATDAFYDVPKLENGETYAALAYTRSAGSLRITSF